MGYSFWCRGEPPPNVLVREKAQGEQTQGDYSSWRRDGEIDGRLEKEKLGIEFRLRTRLRRISLGAKGIPYLCYFCDFEVRIVCAEGTTEDRRRRTENGGQKTDDGRNIEYRITNYYLPITKHERR